MIRPYVILQPRTPRSNTPNFKTPKAEDTKNLKTRTMSTGSRRRNYPRLWQHDETVVHRHDSDCLEESKEETIDDLLERFSSKPPQQSLWTLGRSTWVVAQEFSLSCLLLACHRFLAMKQDVEETTQENTAYTVFIDSWGPVTSLAVAVVVSIVLFYQRPRMDALLLAGILRLLSAVLKTLTASYSSDTVGALAVGGMLVHLLTCDYGYANGSTTNIKQSPSSSRRATFRGGTVSLNAVLVSTTLLASRLESNATVYLFVSSSVILFAFYPAVRHSMSDSSSSSMGTCVSARIICNATIHFIA